MIETPVTSMYVIGATYYNGSGIQIPNEVYQKRNDITCGARNTSITE